MALDNGKGAHRRQTKPAGGFGMHYQKGFCPGARHHTVKQPQRRCDHSGIQILLDGQASLHQRMRIGQRVAALCGRDLAKNIPGNAKAAHVMIGNQREIAIGTAGTIGPGRVVGKMGKPRQCLAKAVQLVGIAGQAGHNFGIPALDGTRRAAQRNHA